ncbi:MAG: hypothetical protein ACXWUR_07650 [Allosphingosinicella sp.]
MAGRDKMEDSPARFWDDRPACRHGNQTARCTDFRRRAKAMQQQPISTAQAPSIQMMASALASS